jgi:hypothetical protein
MATTKFAQHCDICGSEFQYGPHKYNGKYIARYQITVCMPCWESNWDGWAPGNEERLIAHLQKMGLPIPERNSKGWLPRE